MVGQQPLELLIKVRILVPEPGRPPFEARGGNDT